jgi:hypothetical protein
LTGWICDILAGLNKRIVPRDALLKKAGAVYGLISCRGGDSKKKDKP